MTRGKGQMGVKTSGQNENQMSAVIETVDNILWNKQSDLCYEKVYRLVYNLAISGKENKLRDSLAGLVNKYIVDEIRSTLCENRNGDFLAELNARWDQHLTHLGMMRSICLYMEQNVQKGSLSLYDTGVNLFRHEIFNEWKDSREKLFNLIYGLIQQERNGECINWSPIRSIVDMLVFFDLKKENVSTYEEILENDYLQQSEEFYSNEADNMRKDNNWSKYFAKYKERVDEEKQRVSRYLHRTTESKILKILHKQMIANALDNIFQEQNSFECMMKDLPLEDIKGMFCSYSQNDEEWKKKFIHEVMLYFWKTGTSMIESHTTKNRKDFIGNLLNVYENLENICKMCLQDDTFKLTLSSYLTEIINCNPIIIEFLCEFMHQNLMKAENDLDNEKLLTKCVDLFKNLEQKDLFIMRYKHFMLGRITSRKLTSIDLEQQIIQKFKMDSGTEYTRAVEQLITDFQTSNELMQTFKDLVEQQVFQPPFEIFVTLLPLRDSSIEGSLYCALPQEFNDAFTAYKCFYSTRHDNRKLEVFRTRGSVVIDAKFGKKSYILSMTTPQAAVLLIFNNHDKLTFTEILAETGMDDVRLTEILKTFSMCKPSLRLLTRQSQSETIDTEDVFIVNENFKSKMNKVKIPKCGKVCDNQERDNKNVLLSRAESIDSAIVRVMKTKQTLQKQLLITETINIVKNLFSPSPKMINARIDCLIDREYIRKNPKDENTFEYIA